MKRFLITTILLLTTTSLFAAEASQTWNGTWTNRKYGTKGPLKCVATEGEKGVWTGTFTGKFQGDPFKYQATFQAKKGRRKGEQTLSGKSTIRGHKYIWAGSMKGKTLTGKYKSTVGYYGTFVLKSK